jgi:hypothetical protein
MGVFLASFLSQPHRKVSDCAHNQGLIFPRRETVRLRFWSQMSILRVKRTK